LAKKVIKLSEYKPPSHTIEKIDLKLLSILKIYFSLIRTKPIVDTILKKIIGKNTDK